MESILNNYKFLIDHLNEGVYFVDNDRKITYWNDAAERITGFSREEVMGKLCYENILKHIDACGTELCVNGCPLKKTCEDGKIREMDIFLHHKNGHRLPVFVRAIPIMDEKMEIKGAIEIFNSTADEEFYSKIKELEKIAMTDILTGIANRLYIDKFISEKVEVYKVNMRSFGIAFLDIDHFKNINDTYGHDIGDEILKMVGKTLSGNLRGTDLVGRWGGEEFVIFLEKVNGETIGLVLEKLRVMIANSEITVGDKTIKVTASIGGTLINGIDTKESIIKRADTLMYNSKNNGRNKITLG